MCCFTWKPELVSNILWLIVVCPIQKTTIFSKTNAQLFQKKLFPNISVALVILLYNSLLKMNYLYYQFWTKGSLSFSEEVACKCSIKKLRIKLYQSSLAALLKKRLRCISVNLAKFFEKHILQNTCKWLDFPPFYISHSIDYFIQRNNKKGNCYFLNAFNRISTSESYRQKK